MRSRAGLLCVLVLGACDRAPSRATTSAAPSTGSATSPASAPAPVPCARPSADPERDDAGAVDAANAASAADACPVTSIDVSMTYRNARDKVGSVVVVEASAPKLGVTRELARMAGPMDCAAQVTDGELRWSCNEDMGSLYGTLAVEGGALVFKANRSDGFAIPMPGGATAQPAHPAPTVVDRVPWPCGARPSFHPKAFKNHP